MHTRWLETRPAPYQPVWQAMQEFTRNRQADTPDEIWLTEHQPVYTLGQAGKQEHLLNTGAIPVVPTDRAARSPTTVRARCWPTCCSTSGDRAIS